MSHLSIITSEPAQAPADPSASLRAQKAAIAARMDENRRILMRLSNAANAEQAAHEALRQIGEREAEAVAKWAADGAKGDPPSALAAERARALEHLRSAAATASAAQKTVTGINEDLAADQARIDEIAAQLERHALEALASEHAAAIDRLHEVASEFAQLSATIQGLPRAVSEAGRKVWPQDEQHGRELLQIASNMLSRVQRPILDPSEAQIDAAKREWQGKWSTLQYGEGA